MARHFRLLVALGMVLMPIVAGSRQGVAQKHAAEPHRHAQGEKLKNPVPRSDESIARGRQLYQKSCRPCHGPTGKGDGPLAPEGSTPADLTDDVWDHGSSDGEIFLVIRDGAGPGSVMEGWGDRMSETDIWHVVNYLRSLNPKTAGKRP